ncbi:MAG: hypothetical protein KAT90_00230, partial [Gammaproteobacteria bacterium]|nr:hypothetical protein [Gammaproteobacteria bacterium]
VVGSNPAPATSFINGACFSVRRCLRLMVLRCALLPEVLEKLRLRGFFVGGKKVFITFYLL